MSGFSYSWLDLREPVDHAARNEEIVSALCHYFLNDVELKIADIGGGTGSTIRALRPILPQKLLWHVIDNDLELIAEAKRRSANLDVSYTATDLANTIAPIFDPKPDLVTTSAFLDLASQTWAEILVSEVTSRGVPFYGALTYDGRAGCTPSHPLDKPLLEAFNEHQRTDKGFGPALGPRAAQVTEDLFRDAGYTVFVGKSDWEAGSSHREFLAELLKGWHEAACEIQPERKPEFDEWMKVRSTDIGTGRLAVSVGHKDMLAVPSDSV